MTDVEPWHGKATSAEIPPSVESSKFDGHPDRFCGDHRTTGERAWCSDCGEWCYQTAPCTGCFLRADIHCPGCDILVGSVIYDKSQAGLVMTYTCPQCNVSHSWECRAKA